MKIKKHFFYSSTPLLIMVLLLLACTAPNSHSDKSTEGKDSTITHKILHPNGKILSERFSTPPSSIRLAISDSSFAHYLRTLPLKKHLSEVRYYNGRSKANFNCYEAVVDMDIGKKDLHQCADAIMRLRAEYLWKQEKYDSIHFNFTNGFRVDYAEWMKGKRIGVKGNKTWWYPSTTASNTYQDFWKYMEIIFSYAGTLSLSKELQSVGTENMNIGDVFIQGGSPGHAVLVVDMARDTVNGKEYFMLAQSYMPAQEIQILANPNDSSLSPWYSNNISSTLTTPEWSFNKSDLKRFVR